jgi:hypothetical protein
MYFNCFLDFEGIEYIYFISIYKKLNNNMCKFLIGIFVGYLLFSKNK